MQAAGRPSVDYYGLLWSCAEQPAQRRTLQVLLSQKFAIEEVEILQAGSWAPGHTASASVTVTLSKVSTDCLQPSTRSVSPSRRAANTTSSVWS